MRFFSQLLAARSDGTADLLRPLSLACASQSALTLYPVVALYTGSLSAENVSLDFIVGFLTESALCSFESVPSSYQTIIFYFTSSVIKYIFI